MRNNTALRHYMAHQPKEQTVTNFMRPVLATILLGFATTTYAQAPAANNSNAATVNQVPPSGPAQPREERETIEILRAQLEMMRQTDERLLTMVFWALTLTGTLALGLGLFSWFTNNRLYERDKAALEQNLRATVQLAAEQQKSELRKEVIEQVRSEFKALDRSIKEVRYRLARSEGTRDEELGKIGNAFGNFIQTLDLSIDLGDEDGIFTAFENIENLLNSGARLDPMLAADVMKVFPKLPDNFKPQIRSIEHLIEASLERQLQDSREMIQRMQSRKPPQAPPPTNTET